MTDGTDPVSGVSVAVKDSAITGTTGAAGGCTLSNVPVGEVTITAVKEGYVDYSHEETITSGTTHISITLTEE